MPQQPANAFRRFGGQPAPIRIALQDSRQNLASCFPLKCTPARQHLVKDAAERPQIRTAIGFLTVRLLRRHVGGAFPKSFPAWMRILPLAGSTDSRLQARAPWPADWRRDFRTQAFAAA